MKTKKIEKLLTQALLNEEKMEYALYEYELLDMIDDLRLSMNQDKDNYIFSVTENSGHVAMVLIEKAGGVYINEEAREKLKTLWSLAYKSNLKILIQIWLNNLVKEKYLSMVSKWIRKERKKIGGLIIFDSFYHNSTIIQTVSISINENDQYILGKILNQPLLNPLLSS